MAETPKPKASFAPGDILNNTYKIEKRLGPGGLSEVYKATSLTSGRVMAVKAMRSQFRGKDEFDALLMREESVREIQHEAVVRYSDTQRTEDGVVYLVMDYVEGVGLDRRMASGPVYADELLKIARRVASGLAAAHDKGIVHRDLSPDNILLRNDDPSQAVIIDFGIAKDMNPGAETVVGDQMAGKYAYAAPEQLRGRADTRTDIYLLGATLLAAFRGEMPRSGDNPAELIELKDRPLDTVGVPSPLKELLVKMTAPKPEDRFQTAAEIVAAIDATGAVRRPKLGLILGGAALVGLLGGAFFVYSTMGEFGPADLRIAKLDDGTLSASGRVANPRTFGYIADIADGFDGLSQTAGSGIDWNGRLVPAVAALTQLDEFAFTVDETMVDLTGIAASSAIRDTVRDAIGQAAPDGLTQSVNIQIGPKSLPVTAVEGALSGYADCGALDVVNAPAEAYALGATITVDGFYKDEAARSEIEQMLRELIGDRSVDVNGDLLNESLCQVLPLFDDLPEADMDVAYSFGKRGGAPAGDTFRVGDNPVIDLILPDSIQDGFIWVSFIDVKGQVFHLLPNLWTQEHSVSQLRQAYPDGRVRLTYSADDAQRLGKLGVEVDGTLLGRSALVMLHSDEPLFSVIRPLEESAAGFAAALSQLMAKKPGLIRSVNTADLITVP